MSYLTRLGLLLGSLLMVVCANLVGLVAAILGSDRARAVTVANDQALNAALVGAPGSEDETISSLAGKARRRGRRWGCLLCWLLDKVDPGHCDRNIEPDEGESM